MAINNKNTVICGFSLPRKIKDEVDRLARLCKVPRSKIVTLALEMSLGKFKPEPEPANMLSLGN
jgi:metal-responsive CopG/Arc/MetJ family transcriptional regulator